MGIVTELLHTAYGHMDAGDSRSARTILESLVKIDSTNPDVWEAIMQISESCEELDDLCDAMLNVRGINPTDRESVLDYYYFLRQKLRIKNTSGQEQKMITFELVDQFTYTLRERTPVKSEDNINEGIPIQKGVVRLLGRGIIVVYIILLTIGLQLIRLGNNSGYWVMMVLAFSILFNLWNTIVPVNEEK